MHRNDIGNFGNAELENLDVEIPLSMDEVEYLLDIDREIQEDIQKKNELSKKDSLNETINNNNNNNKKNNKNKNKNNNNVDQNEKLIRVLAQRNGNNKLIPKMENNEVIKYQEEKHKNHETVEMTQKQITIYNRNHKMVTVLAELNVEGQLVPIRINKEYIECNQTQMEDPAVLKTEVTNNAYKSVKYNNRKRKVLAELNVEGQLVPIRINKEYIECNQAQIENPAVLKTEVTKIAYNAPISNSKRVSTLTGKRVLAEKNSEGELTPILDQNKKYIKCKNNTNQVTMFVKDCEFRKKNYKQKRKVLANIVDGELTAMDNEFGYIIFDPNKHDAEHLTVDKSTDAIAQKKRFCKRKRNKESQNKNPSQNNIVVEAEIETNSQTSSIYPPMNAGETSFNTLQILQKIDKFNDNSNISQRDISEEISSQTNETAISNSPTENSNFYTPWSPSSLFGISNEELDQLAKDLNDDKGYFPQYVFK